MIQKIKSGIVASIFAAVTVVVPITMSPPAANADSETTFTSVNIAVDGIGKCLFSSSATRCNNYNDKPYVWLNGGPQATSLNDGTYFFAVVALNDRTVPIDGMLDTLSDLNPTSNTGAGDSWTNRVFTVDNGVISYRGTHATTSNRIRLMPFDTTTTPGGVYDLAICKLPSGATSQANVQIGDCKYDSFRIAQPIPIPAVVNPTTSKNALGSYTLMYKWTIDESIGNTPVNQNSDNTKLDYTITVTRDNGTLSGYKVNGTIVSLNSNPVKITGATISDQLSNGTVCTVTGGVGATLVPGKNFFPYSCTLSSLPVGQLNNLTTTVWPSQTLSNGAALIGGFATFTASNISFTKNVIDNCVNLDENLARRLPRHCVSDINPWIVNYICQGPGNSLHGLMQSITNKLGAFHNKNFFRLCQKR